MMSVAKLCKDLGQFTDVTLQCSGDETHIKHENRFNGKASDDILSYSDESKRISFEKLY